MMLSQDDMLVPVRNEIDILKNIALETLRLDNRLRVRDGTSARSAHVAADRVAERDIGSLPSTRGA